MIDQAHYYRFGMHIIVTGNPMEGGLTFYGPLRRPRGVPAVRVYSGQQPQTKGGRGMKHPWTRFRIWLRRLQGRWRLWWGFCPQCNSDAPELYACPVCEYYHGEYPPSAETKAAWWARFQDELYVPPGYRDFIAGLRAIERDNNPKPEEAEE